MDAPASKEVGNHQGTCKEMKKVLTIGAYERDNFGDLLFFILTKSYLKKAIVIPSSIKYSNMNKLMSETVLPYDTLLSKYIWDAIVVVGGEVGGVDTDSALNMSLSGKLREIFINGDKNTKSKIKKFLCCGEETNAYLPDLDKYERNKETPLILSSVGLSFGSSENVNNSIRKSVERSKTTIVRDPISYKKYSRFSKNVFIEPDIAHTLSIKFPMKEPEHPYIVFQMSESLISESSQDKVSKILHKIIKTFDMPILLVAAGTAVGHDSITKYKKMADSINGLLLNSPVKVSHERDPLKIVELIARSKLWIGSSLHGRIVSIAYGVPRISLSVEKVNQYASYWDNKYPYDVNVDERLLIDSIKKSQNIMDKNSRIELAKTLALKADQRITQTFEGVL